MLPATLRGLARVAKATHELVANSLELRHVRHVSLGEQERVRGLVRPARLRVARELRLQASDLAAKLPAPGPLVDLRVRKVGGRRGRLGFQHRLRGDAERRARSVDRPREVARIDPTLAGAFGCLGSQALEAGVDRGVIGHERAQAVPGGDQPLLLEAPVHGAGGVHVHPGASRQLPYARQAIPRLQLPAGDQHPQAPRELRAQRQIVHPRQVGGQGGGRRSLLRGVRLFLVCH
jgi:hypothetical protein